MIFYLEDNKKWSQLMHFFKTCISGNSNICFMWNNVHGWLLMQNSEYLNNLDSDHLVLLSYFRMSYFSSFVNNRDLGLENATFEMDITRIYQSLRSIRKTTKRVMFSLQKKNGNASDYCATFVMKIFDEDGILEIYRDVYLNTNLNQNLYFNHMRNLSQDNILYLEIQQNYLKSVKEFKNCILQLKFYEEHIHVEALNGEQDLVLQINKNICNNYNYSRILSQFDNKNRLLIPPNFLISQIYLANKFNQTIQLQFGDEVIGGRVIVYMRVKNESFEIVSAFSTVFDIDDQTQDNTSPFVLNPQLQQDDIQQNNNNNSYYNLNTNQNNNNNEFQQNSNGQLLQPQTNKQMIQEIQKKSSVQQRNQNMNGNLDQLDSNLKKSKNNKDQKQTSKLLKNQQMIDESQEEGETQKDNRDKEMEVEKIGRQLSNENKKKVQNKGDLNSNQFMEVEAGLENINIRRLRKNNILENEDFNQNQSNSNIHPIYGGDIELDEDEEERNSKKQQIIENGSKKRGSAVLQHLQDEFSSIELLQDGNQNRSIFSSSIGIDSRKQTAHQNNNIHHQQPQQILRQQQQQQKQRKQNMLLQTDGELTDNHETQPELQKNINLKNNLKERNKFLTEQKYLQHHQEVSKRNGQQDKNPNEIQSNYIESENEQNFQKRGVSNKNLEVNGEIPLIDLEGFHSQLVYPVYHDEMEDEDSSSGNYNNGEYPRKHQKLGALEKRNISRINESEEQDQNEPIAINKNKQNMLKKLSDMQMKLITNNKRTVQDMLDESSQFKAQNNNQQLQNNNVTNDELKNKLFYKNQKQQQSKMNASPENKNRVEHKFAKPGPVQGKNIFEQKNNHHLNGKRNLEIVGNYFASHTVSHQQNQELDQESYSEESGLHEGMLKSKLLQRNLENLELLKKEKILKKAKRTLKQGGVLNQELQEFYDNYTQSQVDEDAVVYAKGFFQTPYLKKKNQNTPSSPSMMSQLHSSQKIVQVSNETSESQQLNHILKNKNLFNNNKHKSANSLYHPNQSANYYPHPNHNQITDSEKIDKRGMQRLQIDQPSALIVSQKRGQVQKKVNENDNRKQSINGALNSYNNPLQTNYHSLNTIQSNQSKDLQITQKTQQNHQHTGGEGINSAVQRDRFEQYQKIQNRERQFAGIVNEIKESQIMKGVSPNEISKNLPSSNRISDSQSFKTALESIKPYSFQEPLPRSSKQNVIPQLQQVQLEQQKQNKPNDSVLSKSIRDNSFDNFLKQNKKKDDFSVFSVKKNPQASQIHNQQERLMKQGLEFQPQQQRMNLKQEYEASQIEVNQKAAQSKGMKLFI